MGVANLEPISFSCQGLGAVLSGWSGGAARGRVCTCPRDTVYSVNFDAIPPLKA